MPDQMPEQQVGEMPVFSSPRFPANLDTEPSADWQFSHWCQFILLRYMRELLEQREVVWRNEQVEGVHQIRVAARRLRTALQTFSALWDSSAVRQHAKYLARFADTFGVARDLDVMILYLEAQLHGAHRERRAALEWMLERKRRLRAAQQPMLEEALLKLEEDGYPAAFVEFFSSNPCDLATEDGQR